MGFTNHFVITCHTCKRRRVTKGHKVRRSWDEAKRLGWAFIFLKSRLGKYIWLCPTCSRKHVPAERPPR